MSTVGAWLQLFRVRLLPTAWSNVWTGYALGIATAGAFTSDTLLSNAPRLAVLLVATACLYAIGMGLNDVRDRNRDRDLHPERPLPRGAITFGVACTALLALAAIAISAGAWLGLDSLLWVAITLALIVAYDLGPKEHWLCGPLAMGSVRATHFLFGASTALGSTPPGACVVAGVVVGGYVVLLTSLSQEEETSRSEVLTRKARTLFWGLFLGLVGARALQPIAPWWLAGIGIAIPTLYVGAHALRPLRETPPRAGWTTFLLLRGLLFLDLGILLIYDLAAAGAVTVLLWFSDYGFRALAAPRRPATPTGPTATSDG